MKALNILLVVVLFSFLSSSYAEEKEAQPSSDTKPESLRQALIQAGYEGNDFGRINSFKDFVQFGSASTAQKSRTGDAFDKIEIKKETAKHRDALGKRKFVLDKLALSIVDIENVETKGILAEVSIPFRISHGIKSQSSWASGVLRGRPHPLDAETSYSFLTKDDQLQRCANFQEVNEVRNRNGVLYRAESNISVLVLVIKDDINVLKQIARNPKDYSVSIELTDLSYDRPKTWGFYKEKALIEEDWDCELFRDFWPPIIEMKQPNYFVTKVHKFDGTDNIPEIAMATLVSLSVFDDKKREIIGGFSPRKDITKPIAKPSPPVIKMDLTKIAAAIEKEMVLVPAGKFKMGSPESEKERRRNETQHEVTLTNPFYMGKYEVTQEQWEAVMGSNPSSKTKGAKLPVTDVSWEDCQEFIKKLNASTKGGYRLPTEAEFEYACRAGTTSAYSVGESITKDDANWGAAKPDSIKAVGSYKPNAFGLYDLDGNVKEWCEDWYGDYPEGAVTDPKGPAKGEYRVLRGGSFGGDESRARSSCRDDSSPTFRFAYNGFRLARTADIKTSALITAPKSDPTVITPATKGLLIAPFTEPKAKEVQKEVAKSLKKEVEDKADLGKGIKLEMVLVPAGKFMMGSPASEKGRKDDETQHEVTLTKPFYMGKYEVTQEQWEAVMGNNPSEVKGAKLPVIDVSWEDCQEFIKKLNTSTKGGYRLPYEAEFEYACRAGTTTAYSYGDSLTKSDANFDGDSIKEVGSYKPNAFGLYDLDGNVMEWCEDWYGDYPEGAVTDPKGPAKGEYRVLRGGSFSNGGSNARSSRRDYYLPTDRFLSSGFRLARTP